MALKCIFRFENLDSTRDLNQRSEHLFKKGIYYGGKVTIEPSNVSTIKVSPFRLISYDGMHVLSDSDILLPINVGEFYIVCRAKYVIDDSPDISVFSIDDSTFNSLSDEEKSYYVVFAHVSCDGISITDVNIKEYKEEITQIGRNPNRGYFESEQELSNIEAFEGDFATVKSDNSSEVLLYIYNGTEWISFPNNRVFNVYLANHRTNKDVLVSNTLESVSEDKKNKGAYHINWNQLYSLKNFEFENGHEKISKTQSFYKKDYIQVVPLEYKAIKDENTDVTINYLDKVDNIGSLTEGKYFVDYDNCLVYAWTPSNSQTTTYEINYYYSYKEKLVVSEIEFNKIPRPSELDALKGNNYGINFINKAPSNDNLFITSNSPVPKTMVGTFNVETINNEYYLTTEETNIFIGDDNYKKYFEVLDLEDGLPVYIDDVKVIDNGVVRNVDEENVNEYRNGWFIKRTNCKLALKIVNIGTFTANSLSDSKKVAYHVENGLGDIVEVNNIDYLTNQNNEKNLLKAKNITFDTLFSVDGDNELSINSASVKGINNNTKISTLLNSEIGFFYDNNKVGSIGTVRDNNESFLSIESLEDLNVLSHKNVFIESRYSQTENSEISLEENESKFKVTKYNDYAQIKLITNNSSIVHTTIDSVSIGMAIVTIRSSNNSNVGPYIEVKNDENQSSLYDRGTIKLVSQRTINYIDYRSSIIESVSNIELKNSTGSNYSRYYSFNTRILLENGEVETDNPDNTDTRKYSNVKIEKDNISINTIYGTVTYSKYVSENNKITIESGEAETSDPDNSDTRKYSNIEIEKDTILISTRHGNTSRVDASIDLNETSITTYSSTFVINTNNDETSEYGVEIISNGNNKGIILGTENYSNYVEIKNDRINAESGIINLEAKITNSYDSSIYLSNIILLTLSNGVKIELRPNLIELKNSYAKSSYTITGFSTEVTSENEGKSDIQITKNHVYLTTYNNSNAILGALNLENSKAEVCFGNNKITVNNSIIKSEVTDNNGSSTIVLERTYTNNSYSMIKLSHGQGVTLEHGDGTYTSDIKIKEKLINLSSDGNINLLSTEDSTISSRNFSLSAANTVDISNDKCFFRINKIYDENTTPPTLLRDILSIGIEDVGAYSSIFTIEHRYNGSSEDNRIIALSAGRSNVGANLLSKTNIAINNSIFSLSSKEESSSRDIVENFIAIYEDNNLRYTSIGVNTVDSEQNQTTCAKLVLSNNSQAIIPALLSDCYVSPRLFAIINDATYYIPIYPAGG